MKRTTPTTTRTTSTSTANGPVQLGEAGLETVLVFEYGFDLPEFAAFPLLDRVEGRAALVSYYQGMVDIADATGIDVVLDTPTWRASRAWGDRLGYDAADLDRANAAGVALLEELRTPRPDTLPRISISGSVGPAADAYTADERMTIDAAIAYHGPQMRSLARAGVDVVTVQTMTYIDEAAGATLAARAAGLPVIISFTVETDGVLPSGERLADAIETIDAVTARYPESYGINCAHPDHFRDELAAGATWCERIGLVRANASRQSHAELDNSPELDEGDPIELAADLTALRDLLPNLVTIGGCCGTSHAHIGELGRRCAAAGAGRDLGSRAQDRTSPDGVG